MCTVSYKLRGLLLLSQSGLIPGDSTVNQLVCVYNGFCITTQAVYLIYLRHLIGCGTKV